MATGDPVEALFICHGCGEDVGRMVSVSDETVDQIDLSAVYEALMSVGFRLAELEAIDWTVSDPRPVYRWRVSCRCGVDMVAMTGDGARPSRTRDRWDDPTSGVCPLCGGPPSRSVEREFGPIRWLGECDGCDNAAFWAVTRPTPV